MDDLNPKKVPPVSVKINNPKKVDTTTPPDLVNLKITNPIVYIKYWWKRIMANEGVEVKIKARPVTVFGVAIIAFSLAFGLGGVVLPSVFPWVKIDNQFIINSPTPTSIATIIKDTALKGTLARSGSNTVRYYLITTSTEAVTLKIPDGFNLLSFIGKRILVVGSYDSKNKLLEVEDIQDLEVLSKTPIPIPTTIPTPKPTESPISTSTATPAPEPYTIPDNPTTN